MNAVYKKIPLTCFRPNEIVRDRVGNIFITREGVAAVFGISLVALSTTAKKRGLLPLARYIKGVKPYVLEDVEEYYNRRSKW
ncbi:hypothetical protein [Candidatus Avelusimicrobium faecicola]|jgi:hypothetical protein|uniref:hypothetical protein n=1 Tax=Candidatus Avelusimicrobium faecicola TaxID=3416205 RepID=UPI0015A09E2B